MEWKVIPGRCRSHCFGHGRAFRMDAVIEMGDMQRQMRCRSRTRQEIEQGERVRSARDCDQRRPGWQLQGGKNTIEALEKCHAGS